MRYILHPGYIKSKTDGEMHYIGAKELAHLYKVDIHKCRICDFKTPESMAGFRSLPDDIHCYPRYDGNYPIFQKGGI